MNTTIKSIIITAFILFFTDCGIIFHGHCNRSISGKLTLDSTIVIPFSGFKIAISDSFPESGNTYDLKTTTCDSTGYFNTGSINFEPQGDCNSDCEGNDYKHIGDPPYLIIEVYDTSDSLIQKIDYPCYKYSFNGDDIILNYE